MSPTRSSLRSRKFLLQLAGVGVLATILHMVFSYPASLHMKDSVPGPMLDGVSALGHAWLVYFNVLKGHGEFAFTRMAYYPAGIVFCIRPLLAWYAVIGYIGSLVYENLVFWYNVGLVASSAFTAMGVWVLCLRLTRSPSAALLGAVLYTFGPRRMDALQGHINYYSTGFLVWALVAMQAGLRKGSGARPWLAAGALWAMQVWQSPDMMLFLGFCWVPLTLWVWWRGWVDHVQGAAAERRNLWAPLLAPLMAGLSILPIVIAAVPYLHLRLSSDQVPWPRAYWYEFLYPSPRNHLYRAWGRFVIERFHDPGHNEAFIGFAGLFSILLFLAVGACRLRRMRPWLILSVVALILLLGTTTSILGLMDVPLPYRLMLHVPVLKELRIPSRFNTLFTLGVSLMGAMGWAVYRRRRLRAPRAVWAVLLGLALLDAWFVPVPFTKLRNDPRYYPMRLLEEIRRDPAREISVLGVPVEVPATISQAQQMIHEHPTYDGYDPRLREEQIEQMLLGPIRFLWATAGNVSLAEVEKRLAEGKESMSVTEFQRRIAPARLKYILLGHYQNPRVDSQREIIRRYFRVLREERDGFWTLFMLEIEKSGSGAPPERNSTTR